MKKPSELNWHCLRLSVIKCFLTGCDSSLLIFCVLPAVPSGLDADITE